MTNPVISDEVVEAAIERWFDRQDGVGHALFVARMRSAITAAILSDREHTRAEADKRIAELEAALRNYSCDCDDTFPDGIQECNGDHDVAWCGYRANQVLRSRPSHTDKGGE
jgi:hypothetical protein